MDDRRDKLDGGLSGWVAQRAGDWELTAQDEATLQRQKFFWNVLVDYWFRMEIDGWENVGKPPALLVGIHS
ncbi:MAG: glycerol acyltransferase, partial [Mycobacterium sp.]|nr:glycerol acyltransferase [Mycobacterium sp.]